jgi:carbon monoxide dehydrogenase subunit G
MQLEHAFTIPVGIEAAWKMLLDIEQVAACLPGAVLETVDGEDFHGTVKLKLGPIGLTYKGKAAFIEKDATTHRAIFDAQGKDARGNGTAAAKITAELTAENTSSTRVEVTTDLDVTGKPAQFGRGVMIDAGNKLISQFADCLASKVGAGPAGAVPAVARATKTAVARATKTAAATKVPAKKVTAAMPASAKVPAAAKAPARAAAPIPAPTTSPSAAPTAPSTIGSTNVEPIDLMASARPAMVKRLIPAVAAAAIVIVALVLGRRHLRSR